MHLGKFSHRKSVINLVPTIDTNLLISLIIQNKECMIFRGILCLCVMSNKFIIIIYKFPLFHDNH